jgi:tetratricopeptide (TPR) repeat protein
MKYCSAARKLAVAVLALGVQACSIYSLPGQEQPAPPPPVVTPQPAPQPSEPVTSAQPPVAPVDDGSAGYSSLLTKAESAADRGDYEQALALLERAQRIDPDSGAVYLAMARTYAAKGDTAMAQATAQRGLLYCEGSSQCRALRRYL